MPSFLKTFVVSALVACPTVFASATKPEGDKKDGGKDKKSKDKKTESSVEGLDTVIAKRFPKVESTDREKLRAVYQSSIHKAAAFSHSMVTDELTSGGFGVVVALDILIKETSEDVKLEDAYKAIATAESKLSKDEIIQKMVDNSAMGADEATKVFDTPIFEAGKAGLSGAEELKKFDEGVKPLVARLVAALRSIVESKTECALGLCDKKVVKSIEDEKKRAVEKAKKEEKKDKKEEKKEEKMTADKALKNFDEMVVEVEKEAKMFFSATRIGSTENKIKTQKASNLALALGLGLGLGLGLPFIFGVGSAYMFKTERWVWNHTA